MLHQPDLRNVVVPITEHVGGPLPQLGSGCFFQRAGRLYLVTATHVIERSLLDAPKRIMVPKGPSEQSELWTIGGGHLTSAPSSKEDVAVFRLDNLSMISDVLSGGWRVLTDDDVEVAPFASGVVCGWPHARLRPVDGGLKGVLMAFNVERTSPPSGAQDIRATDIFFSWPAGTQEPMPKLGGISGSPLWSRRGDELRLAGVQHAVCEGEYIRGTQWGVVDYILRSRA
jgi:hypothetical protein